MFQIMKLMPREMTQFAQDQITITEERIKPKESDSRLSLLLPLASTNSPGSFEMPFSAHVHLYHHTPIPHYYLLIHFIVVEKCLTIKAQMLTTKGEFQYMSRLQISYYYPSSCLESAI